MTEVYCENVLFTTQRVVDAQRQQLNLFAAENAKLLSGAHAQEKVAYLNKERSAQNEGKILLAAREQERIQAIEEQMEFDRKKALKNEAFKIDQKKESLRQQRMLLQDQINERQSLLLEAQRQAELDKAMVDAIVQNINQEDNMDIMKRKKMQEATRSLNRDYEE